MARRRCLLSLLFPLCAAVTRCVSVVGCDGWPVSTQAPATGAQLLSGFFSPRPQLLRAVLISGLKWADLSSELSSTDPYYDDHDLWIK